MNEEILQIVKHLSEYFPNKHIELKITYFYYRYPKEYGIIYSIYIEDFKFSTGSAWSDDYIKINNLIDYINGRMSIIPNWINISILK